MAATLPTDRQRKGYTEDLSYNDGHSSQRSRRQWNIQDGPRGLLRRMRSQLAEDGDPESQVVLAKALLEARGADDVTVDAADCCRQAVFWLSRASLQGHREATQLLEDCVRGDIGISEHNYHEVQQCLAMPLQEKVARRAARALFARLSDGNDFVTSSMLAANIRELLDNNGGQQSGQSAPCSTDSSLEARYGGERFLEEHMTAAATSYCQGHLPPLQHFLPSFQTLTSDNGHQEQPHAGLSTSWLRWRCDKLAASVGVESSVGKDASSSSSPVTSTTERIIKYLGMDVVRKIKYWYYGMTGSRVIMLILMIFCLFSVLRKDTLIYLFPWMVLLTSLVCMMVSTCTILINYRHLDEFKVWSVVLKHYCSELSTESAENKFQSKWFVPYIGLFLSLLIFLSVKPFVTNCVVQLPVLIAFSLLSLSCSIKRVGLTEHVSFLLYFSAITSTSFSGIVDEYAQKITPTDLYPYLQWTLMQKWNLNLWSVLNLNIGIISFFQVIWLLTILWCFMRKGWIMTATLLVSSTWCSLSLYSLLSLNTASDVLYSGSLWLTLLLCPVLWSLFYSTLPLLCVLVLCLNISSDWKVISGAVLFYVIVHYVLQRYLPKVLSVVRQILFWTCVVCLLVTNGDDKVRKETRPTLQWDSYHNMCIPSTTTEASTVLNCRRLEGMLINWQGTVTDVSITSLVNWPEYLLSWLPLSVAMKNLIRCNIGEPIPTCNRVELELQEYERCVLLANIYGKDMCSLDNWNYYEFAVKLTMDATYWKINKDSQDVIVTLNDRFRNVALALRPGEILEFEGILSSGIGTKNLQVLGLKTKCSYCKNISTHLYDDYKQNNSFYCSQMFASIFNFFFAPTLTI